MTKNDTSIFISNLKVIMKRKNFNIKTLSTELQIPASTIHGWLNGVPPKNIFQIKSLANKFECSIDELFFEKSFSSINTDIVISIGETKLQLFLRKIT